MSTTEQTLAPCPFCGDYDPEVAQSSVPNAHGGHKQAVYCNGCFCEGPTADSDIEAIAAWKRRAHLSAAPTVQEGTAGEVSDTREVLRELVRLKDMDGAIDYHYQMSESPTPFLERARHEAEHDRLAQVREVATIAAWDRARALLSSTPVQGARMLTEVEVVQAINSAHRSQGDRAEAIQRKFAEVNRIQLAPTGAEGGQHG